MSENRLQRLADDLIAQLNEYLNLKTDVIEAWSRLGTDELDAFELRAVGSILHDVYNGAEGICQHIAKEIDQHLPVGGNWHRDLLDQMIRPLAKTRPAVIQPETAALLENYRSYRHVFRNIYGSRLDWIQMKPLLENAATVIDTFVFDVEQFVAFLRLMTTDNQGDR